MKAAKKANGISQFFGECNDRQLPEEVGHMNY